MEDMENYKFWKTYRKEINLEMKKTIYYMLAVVVLLMANKCDLSAAEFDITSGVLTAVRGEDTEIMLPSDVKEIGEDVFAGNKKISRVYIPEGVISIGSHAFDGCSSLSVLLLPLSIESIGADAFSGCPELMTVGYRDGTKKSVVNWLIENEIQYKLYGGEQSNGISFDDMKIYYPQLNQTFTKNNIIYKIIKKDKKNMEVSVSGCDKDKKIIKIPKTVTFQRKTYKITAIAEGAFKRKSHLCKVIAGKNIRKIENSAFINCKKLSIIVIQNKKCIYNKKIAEKGSKFKIIIKE